MRRTRSLLPLLLALILLAFAVGAYLGRDHARRSLAEDPQTAYSMHIELAELREALAEANGEKEMMQTRHEVDRQALELVRLDIAAEKDRAAELEEGLRFYRSLMAPQAVTGGLSVRPPELVATEQPNQYAFQLVIQQKARKHDLLKGKLSVEIIGLVAGLEVSYPLDEVSEGFSAASVPLQFRYFQSVEGKLDLPQGFEPTAVAVAAVVTKPRKMELTELFPWQLQERLTHVGK